nr:uncharacterized protein LOC123760407 isoform X2 [Procambarus clarkii]
MTQNQQNITTLLIPDPNGGQPQMIKGDHLPIQLTEVSAGCSGGNVKATFGKTSGKQKKKKNVPIKGKQKDCMVKKRKEQIDEGGGDTQQPTPSYSQLPSHASNPILASTSRSLFTPPELISRYSLRQHTPSSSSHSSSSLNTTHSLDSSSLTTSHSSSNLSTSTSYNPTTSSANSTTPPEETFPGGTPPRRKKKPRFRNFRHQNAPKEKKLPNKQKFKKQYQNV